MTANNNALGERIQQLRKNLGLSQEEVAKVLGLHRPSISQIEHGERDVTAQELFTLSQLLGVTMDELIKPRSQKKSPKNEKAGTTTITFFRHGEAVDDIYDQYGGWAEPDLTPRGINQAYTSAQNLKAQGVTYDIIYTSPLLRAKRVAEVFSSTLGVDMKIMQYLKEWNKYGLLSGINKQVALKKFPELVEAYDKGRYVLGSEREPDLIARIPLIFSYIERETHTNIACITHGNVLKYTIREMLNMKSDHIGDLAMIKMEQDKNKLHYIQSEGITFKK